MFENVLRHPLKTQQQWTFKSQICSLASAVAVKIMKLYCLLFYYLWGFIENTKRLPVFKLKIDFSLWDLYGKVLRHYIFNILIASQRKKFKCLFTYQAAVNELWFGKGNYNGAIPAHAKAGIGEERGGFWTLGHKFLKTLRRQSCT